MPAFEDGAQQLKTLIENLQQARGKTTLSAAEVAEEFAPETELFTRLVSRLEAVNLDLAAAAKRRGVGKMGVLAADMIQQGATDLRSGKMTQGMTQPQKEEVEAQAVRVVRIGDEALGMSQRLSAG